MLKINYQISFVAVIWRTCFNNMQTVHLYMKRLTFVKVPK